jgi:ferredoxin
VAWGRLAARAKVMLYSGLFTRRRANAPAMTRRCGMQVEADWDACESNAVCAGLVPEVFEIDDDDNLQITPGDVPAALEQQVRHAVSSCPKMALRIAE